MRTSILALLLCAACTVPESANPTPRCEAQDDCTKDEHCYRGLCVPDEGSSRDDRMERDAWAPPPVDAGPPEPTCDDGKSWCDEHCVDTRNDDDHCGGCSQTCGNDEDCRGGRCEEKD